MRPFILTIIRSFAFAAASFYALWQAITTKDPALAIIIGLMIYRIIQAELVTSEFFGD